MPRAPPKRPALTFSTFFLTLFSFFLLLIPLSFVPRLLSTVISFFFYLPLSILLPSTYSFSARDESSSPYPTPFLPLPPLAPHSPNDTLRSVLASVPFAAPPPDPPVDFSVTARRVAHLTLCTFRAACVAPNNTLLLHPSLRQHAQTIVKTCSGMGVQLHFYKTFNHSAETAGTHLLSVRPLAFHIPHFMNEALAAQLLSGPSAHSVVTIPATKNNASTTPPHTGPTAMYVEDRVLDQKASAWVPRSTILFPGPPRLVGSSILFPSSSSSAGACFKTVTSLPMPHPAGDYSRALSVRPAARRPALWRGGACRPIVTLMDREPYSGRRYLGRNLHDASTFMSTFLSNTSNSPSSALPVARRTLLEGMPIGAQAAVVRRSHLIIGVHGAGLTNVLFATRGTVLLELFPYAYYPELFERFASWYGLVYDYAIAPPDSDTFWKCIEKMNVAELNDVKVFKRYWGKEARLWGNKTRVSDILTLDPAHPLFKTREQSAGRMCARSQRLMFNPAALSALVWAHVERLCNAAR